MPFQQRLGQANVTSLMERVTRFTVLLRNTSKRSKPVMGKTPQAIAALPLPVRRSITADRGSEFVAWPQPAGRDRHPQLVLRRAIPAPEGRRGEYQPPPPPLPPHGIDLRKLTDADIRAATDRTNDTPRECLGWKTPADALAEKAMEIDAGRAYPRSRRT